MTASPQSMHQYTAEEYLRMEYDSEQRHEFFNGEVIAMAGGTIEHAIISSNILRALGNRLEGSDCRAVGSDMRVRAALAEYTYPDVSVICGAPVFDPQDRRRTTVTNPRVIIEVLSLSTERRDRGEKFEGYIQLKSLEEYILISQDHARVETFHRQSDGTWSFAYFDKIEAIARLRCLKIEVPMSEIYAGVEFPRSPENKQNSELD